jgi:hypothetical protein
VRLNGKPNTLHSSETVPTNKFIFKQGACANDVSSIDEELNWIVSDNTRSKVSFFCSDVPYTKKAYSTNKPGTYHIPTKLCNQEAQEGKDDTRQKIVTNDSFRRC